MRSREEIIRDTAPFPDRFIANRQGPGGKTISYVTWSDYAQRLIAHHPNHDYKITHLEHGDTWAVAVVLVLNGSSYAGVGEGDTPTSAESNAYKRACAHAGIGLHLYTDHYWLPAQLEKESTPDQVEG